MKTNSINKPVLFMDKELEEVIQSSLVLEKQNICLLEIALFGKNFSFLGYLGDQIYGHGASLGFTYISEVGKCIEIAAKEKDANLISSLIKALKFYLQNLDIIYV